MAFLYGSRVFTRDGMATIVALVGAICRHAPGRSCSAPTRELGLSPNVMTVSTCHGRSGTWHGPEAETTSPRSLCANSRLRWPPADRTRCRCLATSEASRQTLRSTRRSPTDHRDINAMGSNMSSVDLRTSLSLEAHVMRSIPVHATRAPTRLRLVTLPGDKTYMEAR